MASLEEEKILLRKKIEGRRNQLSALERKTKSELACSHILNEDYFAECKYYSELRVCLYMPFRSEIDITPVMEWCWQRGCKAYIPKVIRREGKLQLHEVASYDEVSVGEWGILEPKENTPVWNGEAAIDILFVPGLAFDLQGGRVGYGGGYYDRFIESYNKRPLAKPIQLAAAFDLQLVESIPLEAHDIRVTHIVTESGAKIIKNS
jgi:5-formyltetrahydrofolate cyclo-ligase